MLAHIGGFPALWRVHRWLHYGLIGFALLVLAGLGVILYKVYSTDYALQTAAIEARAEIERKLIKERSEQQKHVAMAAKQAVDDVLTLDATNRLAEAEPLMRRAVIIMLKSTRATGHELPNLRRFFGNNYQALLADQHLKPQALAQRLDSLGPEAGYTAFEWAALQAAWEQVRVAGVVPGSQAEGLGLQPGDVITRYAGEKITNSTRLIELTGQTKTPAIPLTILRAGKEITLTARPGKLGVQLE